jgi:hypothetical protein
MSRRLRLLASTLLITVAACAGAGRQGVSTTSNVIDRAELEAAGSVSTYDAVQRLRPQYLRDRGPVSLVNTSARPRAVVFLDQTEYGELETLRTIPASRVEQVRFYPGAEAATKFGSVYGSGVIQLNMRTQ